MVMRENGAGVIPRDSGSVSESAFCCIDSDADPKRIIYEIAALMWTVGLPGRAALLILPAAAAGAQIIAASFYRCGAESRGRLPLLRYLPRKWLTAVQEETLQSSTEVVEARIAIGCLNETVFGAATVAHSQHFALPAITREGVALGCAEIPLHFALQQLVERRLPDIAQPVVAVDEVVARKEIAVVFEYRDLAASLAEDTQRMLLAERRSGGLLERLNHYAADIAPDPLIEDLAQERAILFRRRRMRADAAHRFQRSLDGRQKTQIPATNFAEEAVDGEWRAHVPIVHDAEDVGSNFHSKQEIVGAHRLSVSRFAASSHPVRVVQLRRAVEAQTHAEPFTRQEATPFFVQQDSVGLDTVSHMPAGGFVLALQGDGLLKEIHSQGCGLSAVPREVDIWAGRSFKVLDDIFLQQAFRHMERAGVRVEAAFVPVVAVLAIEVAHSSRWFNEDLKLSGYFTHCSISGPQGTR
jgi:hypothetical protein